jgi:disulfide bond formation protein DsbB
MNMQLHTFDVVYALSVLTIVGQVCALALIVTLALRNSAFHIWISRHALVLMLIVALIATCGSLFFSEIAQWTPCKDCWLQRIFMYPEVVLLAIALWKKDRNIAPYILVLSLIGMIIAIDHYADQFYAALYPQPDEAGVNILLKPCDASGVSCAATQINFYFGYITIPMMAMTAFLLNAIGSVYLLRSKK